MQLRLGFSTAIRASSLLAMMSLMIAMMLGVSVVSAQGTYCTEHDETQWHPAVDPVTGCLYGHEHGDNPMPAGTPFEPLTFGGDEATPHENIFKHNGYKVFYLHRNNGNAIQDNGDACDDLRVRIHMDVTPAARRGQYHSYEVDVAHCAGGQLDVSRLQGWIDFGTTVNLSTREGGDPGVRPNKFAPSENEFNQNGLNIWEVWYGRTGHGIDMGWLLGEVPTVDHNGSDPNDPSTWTWTGGVGRKRKLENFNFYGWLRTQRGEFWTDSLANIVDPNSEFCQTNQCLRQYISPLFGRSGSDQIILLYNGHHEYDSTGVNFPATHPLLGDLPWMDNGSDPGPDPVPQPEPPTGPAVFFEVDDSNAETVNVNVQLIGVSGVYGLEVQCAVDPTILQGTAMVPGAGFNNSNSFIIDNGYQADGIWNVAASRLKPNPAVDGDALAFTFEYNVLTTGDSTLR